MKETKTVIGYFKQNVIDALNLNIKAGTPIKFGEINKTYPETILIMLRHYIYSVAIMRKNTLKKGHLLKLTNNKSIV